METEKKENVKRARNFTDFDKNLLFEIVQKYMNIIENKKTDATNIKIKNEIWDSVKEEFNSNCQSGNRTSKQLHALYDGMKKKARKNLHEDKKELYKTGGGVFTPKSDTIDTKIVETLSTQFKPLENQFDSSANYLKQDVIYVLETGQNVENSVQQSKQQYLEIIGPQLDDSQHILVSKQGDIDKEPIEQLHVPPQIVSTPSTSVKKRNIHLNKSAEKRESSRESYLNKLSTRMIERKNRKDDIDTEITHKKVKILEVDEAIKKKELEAKTMEVEYLKVKYDMELQHMRSKHELELDLLKTELKIKKRI
ncbi:hypothetical protein NQ315_007937 [Exocentrus adspersus]|uniref:Regulatory protein zeste n=1 Tax=Exocentrus adspersus TaxID=1586481 RepID=A0AAV8VBY6_9CUCU|nr:hypothetical protein NQ315_007937 [Exocentrus adspersus]